jgi:hypothetical protein
MGVWDRNADWNRDVLERIVALLFALACLAELAACLPFLRRQQLLGILSHGEAEARAFVIGLVSGAAAPADAPEFAGDAAGLAARLRALALLLCALLARAGRSAIHPSTRLQTRRQRTAEPAGHQAPPPSPDTS